MRREFPKKVMAEAFKRSKGCCESCTAFLRPGQFHYDHDMPDQMGGEPTLENCKVLCRACHGEKTSKRDIPMIAKAKRIHAKHIGARKPSRFPGSKDSPFKKKVDGTVVPR